MLETTFFRDHLLSTATALQKRDFILNTDEIQTLEALRKSLQVATETLQSQRNSRSKSIGQAKVAGQDITPLLNEVSELGTQLDAKRAELVEVQDRLQAIYAGVPNLLHDSVPVGKDENDNIEIRRWGEPVRFDFPTKDHVDLGAALGQMDFQTAAKITGARFVCLQHQLARLQRALIQFMLDTHTQQHAYTEVYVPYLVNHDSLRGTGQLPKFADDQFFTNSEQQYALIPTAEVPLTNMFRDEIVDADQLPLKLTAHTPCFRKEAGSHGKDTRGMIRQHQFEKVEMVQLVKPEDSYQALEELTAHAEAILQQLGLAYRVVTLCSGDTGFSAAKTYDLEVWLPSQQGYREISSCSNFESFQARRLQARWRNPNTGKPELLHTLNGSGLAVGRTLVAIMENYQQADGSIVIPEALQAYLPFSRIMVADE